MELSLVRNQKKLAYTDVCVYNFTRSRYFFHFIFLMLLIMLPEKNNPYCITPNGHYKIKLCKKQIKGGENSDLLQNARPTFVRRAFNPA